MKRASINLSRTPKQKGISIDDKISIPSQSRKGVKEKKNRKIRIPKSLSKTFQARSSHRVQTPATLFSKIKLAKRKNSLPKPGKRPSPLRSTSKKVRKGFRSTSLANPKFFTKALTVSKEEKKKIKNSLKNPIVRRVNIRSKSNESETRDGKLQRKMKMLRKSNKKELSLNITKFDRSRSRHSISRVTSLSKNDFKFSPNHKRKGNSFHQKQMESLSNVAKRFKILKNSSLRGKNIKMQGKRAKESPINGEHSPLRNTDKRDNQSYGLLKSLKRNINGKLQRKILSAKKKTIERSPPKKIFSTVQKKKSRKYPKSSIVGKNKRRGSPRDFLKQLMNNSSTTPMANLLSSMKSRSPKQVTGTVKKRLNIKTENFASMGKKGTKPKSCKSRVSHKSQTLSKWKRHIIGMTETKQDLRKRRMKKKKEVKKEVKKLVKEKPKKVEAKVFGEPGILSSIKETPEKYEATPEKSKRVVRKMEKISKFARKESRVVSKSNKNLKSRVFQNFECVEFNMRQQASKNSSILTFGFSPCYTFKMKHTRKFLKMRKEVREIRSPCDKLDVIQLRINYLLRQRDSTKSGNKNSFVLNSDRQLSKKTASPGSSNKSEADPLVFQQKVEEERVNLLREDFKKNFKKNSFINIGEHKERPSETPSEKDHCVILFSSTSENMAGESPISDKYSIGNISGQLRGQCTPNISPNLRERVQNKDFSPLTYKSINPQPCKTGAKDTPLDLNPDPEPEDYVPSSPLIKSRNFELEGPMEMPAPSIPKGFPSFYAEEKNMEKFLKELSPLDSKILEVSAEYREDQDFNMSSGRRSQKLIGAHKKLRKSEEDPLDTNEIPYVDFSQVGNQVPIIQGCHPKIIFAPRHNDFADNQDEAASEEKVIDRNSLIYKKKKSQKRLQKAKEMFENPRIERDSDFSEEKQKERQNYYEDYGTERDFEPPSYDLLGSGVSESEGYSLTKNDRLDTVIEEDEEDISQSRVEKAKDNSNILLQNNFLVEKSSEIHLSESHSRMKEFECEGTEFGDTPSSIGRDFNAQIARIDKRITNKIKENKKKIHILERYLNKMESGTDDFMDEANTNDSKDSNEGYFCDFHSDSFKIGRVEIIQDMPDELEFYRTLKGVPNYSNFSSDFGKKGMLYDQVFCSKDGEWCELRFDYEAGCLALAYIQFFLFLRSIFVCLMKRFNNN